jgi:hypothetical protein
MKKKKKSRIDIWKGIRNVWLIDPVTKVKPNSKKKSRAKIKREFKRDIEDT